MDTHSHTHIQTYGCLTFCTICFGLVNSDNEPTACTNFVKLQDGKLQSHLEWPNRNQKFRQKNLPRYTLLT